MQKFNWYKIHLPDSVIKTDDDILAEFNPEANFTDIRTNAYEVPVDAGWHTDKYGFALTSTEIEIFRRHYQAWREFAETEAEWCLIAENTLGVELDEQRILETLASFDEDWDVFFPYNKFLNSHQDDSRATKLLNPNIREIKERDPFLLGLMWGSSIYFLSKSGATRLLQMTVIRQRVEDEVLSLSKQGAIQTLFSAVPWFDEMDLPENHIPERDEAIRAAIFGVNAWSPEEKEQARDLLNRVSRLAGNLGVELILQGGTHLGYIRHGGIMPWDDDIDIGIEEKYLAQFTRHVKADDVLKMDTFVEPHTGIPFYKIWLSSGQPIENHKHSFPFLDLWVYNVSGTNIVFKNGIVCPNSASKPFLSIIFEGATFQIPYNSIECLDARYKDWKTQLRVYRYSHKIEDFKFPLLKSRIEVDEYGRLVT